MRCQQCGYDLAACTSPRCPECGKSFNPADARTYLSRPASGVRALELSLVALALFGAPLLVPWLSDLNLLNHDSLGAFAILLALGPVLMVGGFTLAVHIVIRSARALSGKPPWVTRSHCFVLAIILSSIPTVTFLVVIPARLLLRLLATLVVA